ncbi:hypothetical protein J057_24220 [Marinobacter nanhaiticus D15-8W]|uniref:Uncharacterized protein n=1 Tax=Marinobacter nanhaiticus D15-8W TaxID=626887 RepID=A0A371CGC1_9GAMM|nr:hypothetical protein J057_24220 [Marinobacter nanhaiticus D15-8W]
MAFLLPVLFLLGMGLGLSPGEKAYAYAVPRIKIDLIQKVKMALDFLVKKYPEIRTTLSG